MNMDVMQLCIILLFLLIITVAVAATSIANQFYTCPITGKRDFKHNMYEHRFPMVDCGNGCFMSGHTAWYTKEGYEKGFKCIIRPCEKNTKGWRAYPIPKERLK